MAQAQLLIVEDRIEEAIYAQGEAAKAGYTELLVATDLETALKYLPSADRVATDLFFPAGNVSTTDFSKRILPLYEDFKRSRFSKQEGSQVVLRAVCACAEMFGITPKEYVEIYMPKFNTIPSVLRAARDAVAGINDSVRYNQFLTIEEDIRAGRNLPLGIIVAEEAKEKGLPTIIVTSTNHHDHAFEPVRNLITVSYLDNLVEGRKNWEGAMNYLKNNEVKK
jgi:hypothetical protein